ncbi:MAG: nuclear transport factor 2 family protein [Pseudonocardiaceae bacterium]
MDAEGEAMTMMSDFNDVKALDPFFRIIEEGLDGLVDGGYFFDLLAHDVVFEFVITVPDYPRRVVGRDKLIELYRGYGSTFLLDRCYGLVVHRAESTVVLEYASQGKVIANGQPYGNHYISVVTITDRKITHWRDYLDPLAVFEAVGWPSPTQ